MRIRELTTLDECRRWRRSRQDVWGYTDSEDVVPPPVLIVSIKRGGILLGAFDARRDEGFVYSIPASRTAAAQWSHMLGVTGSAGTGPRPAAEAGQREHASPMGVDLIEWTYDPLQALNAHLNFTKLGVVVEEYEENIYGESSSRSITGSPTDRFVAEWKLDGAARRAPDRRARLGLVRDASVDRAPLVNPRGRRQARSGRRPISARRIGACSSRFRALHDMLTADPRLRSNGGSRRARSSSVLRARVPRGGFLPGSDESARTVSAGVRDATVTEAACSSRSD
jgi:predicted GNAT superfamily acetyltransferase